MIARQARQGETVSTVWLSECGAYRYRLRQVWGAGAWLTAVLLNPSTATEAAGDATLARVARRARAAGFGGVEMLNLYALRGRDPGVLRRAGDPVGPGNAAVLAGAEPVVLCGWGNGGLAAGRGVAAMLRAGGRRMLCLGLTRRGAPRHPLYVAGAQGMEDWDG
ncbi:MAG: DUF1643 domain-containing protein [Gemmobacter sp.]